LQQSQVNVDDYRVEQAFMPAFMPAVKRHRKYRLQMGWDGWPQRNEL